VLRARRARAYHLCPRPQSRARASRLRVSVAPCAPLGHRPNAYSRRDFQSTPTRQVASDASDHKAQGAVRTCALRHTPARRCIESSCVSRVSRGAGRRQWAEARGAGSGSGRGDPMPRAKCKYSQRVGVSGRPGYRWKALAASSLDVSGVPKRIAIAIRIHLTHRHAYTYGFSRVVDRVEAYIFNTRLISILPTL
jgi:hypothetical protein